MHVIKVTCATIRLTRVGINRPFQTNRLYHATSAWRTDDSTQVSYAEIDRKWRKVWQEAPVQTLHGAATPSNKKALKSAEKDSMYILPMFPYPSGTLHMGHFRVYTISDVLSRFQRMQGHEVMHPIGWDAFGLPAENAARDRGLHPEDWTYHNISEMWKQLEKMNGRWDTDREFATCDASFYKHTQRLFLLLHEHDLAYQADAMVNYDPVDKTVLANEQVDANGYSWRSGAKVEKKMLRQWFFKISEFRQQLLDDLDHLAKDGSWPERVLTMQRNWLGKSVGGRIKFPTIAYGDDSTTAEIEVFTTRPDTLFGVQYLALSSTHPIVQERAKSDPDLKAILEKFPALPEDSKFGHVLQGLRALNPLASEVDTPDATKASIPIYVAPYVLGDYGGGAVMGVPGHDIRDFAFWQQNCPEQPVRLVVESKTSFNASKSLEPNNTAPFTGKGILSEKNGPYSGRTSEEATTEILNLLESKGFGASSESWRIRDWLVSRQRYWGAPIPMVHCGTCGPVPVPENELPVKLPKGKIDWTKSNGNELFSDPEWLHTSCPKCSGKAKRETDTMDTFVDSSWYFMRFPDPLNEHEPFSATSANKNLPVDLYIGGVEHAILHLLYARFISKFLATTDFWPAGSSPAIRGEPFKRVLTQGMVHGKTYSDPVTGKFLKPDDVDLTNLSKPIVISTGEVAKVTYEKMSKSKYNGVDPSACVEKYGADVTRAHMLFQAPVSDVLEWDEEKISGVRRWFNKLTDMVIATRLNGEQIEEINNQEPLSLLTNPTTSPHTLEADKTLWRTVQTTILSVIAAYSKTYTLNTIISDLMSLTNAIQEHQTQLLQQNQKENMNKPSLDDNPLTLPHITTAQIISHQSLTTLLKLLAPIAPAVCEELWYALHTHTMPFTSTTSPSSSTSSSTPSSPSTSTTTSSPPPSIHTTPFPSPPTPQTLSLLSASTITCAIQVNGKLRHTLDIPSAMAGKGKEVEEYIMKRILESDEARGKLVDGKVDVRRAKKVVVVRGGKTVNFVV